MTRRPGWVLVDLLAVLALVAAALVGLASTFDGWGYLVVALVAAVLGLVVVLVTARLPLAVLIAGVPLMALVAGGPVALRSKGFGAGFPNPQTLADVMQGTWTGWHELLTTLPWVDLAGPPAMVPFLLGYLGAVLAGALAVRTSRAAAPVLPLLLVLAAVLLLRRPVGTGSTLLDWYPVAFAVAAIGWVVVRGLQTAPGVNVSGARHGRLGRGLTALVVVAGVLLVAVPLTARSTTPSGETLRGRSAALTDFSGLDSPMRRFRTFTDQGEGALNNVHRRVLFTVTGAPRGSRVRMVTLDRFDGDEWLPGNGTVSGTDTDSFQRLDTRVDNPNLGPPIAARVAMSKSYNSAWIPTVGSLTSLRLVYADPRGLRNDMRYNLATSTAVLPTGLGRQDAYEFTAVVPEDALDDSMATWTGARPDDIAGLDRLDDYLPEVFTALIPPMQKVFALAHYLRDEGRYSDGAVLGEQQYEAGQGLDRVVDDFLLAERPIGNDEQYASAMALLVNKVGVPARVVVGAVLPRDGKVRGEDVHAWVEVRLLDGSWRTLPTKEFMSRTPPRAQLPPPSPPRLPQGGEQPEQQPRPETPEEKSPAQRQAEEEQTRTLVRTVPWVVLLVLGLVVPTLKLARRRLRRTRGRASDRMAGGWNELVDRARDLGVPVQVHATRPAQARALVPSGAPSRVEELSGVADDGVFAPGEPSEEAVTAFWSQVMDERRGLKEGRALRRRVWAPFNPATLVRRRSDRAPRRRGSRPTD